MLNIEKLFVLIAARPQIRTVEIADLIDCEPEQVQPALQPHVDSGNLTLIEVTAPNGRPANGFMITRQFMDSELYQVLLPSIKEQRAADGQMKPVPTPAPVLVAPKPPEKSMTAPGVQRAAAPRQVVDEPDEVTPASSKPAAPVPRKMGETPAPVTSTVIQRVIEYLREHGPVTSAELRPVVGVGQQHYPSNYFQLALRDGRILRHGRLYSLPVQALPVDVAAAPAAPAPLDQAVPVVVGPFRFARWSDGSIDLHRDGKIAITLTPAECVQLAPSVALTTMEQAR